MHRDRLMIVLAFAIALSIPVLGGWLKIPVFREIFYWQDTASRFLNPGL